MEKPREQALIFEKILQYGNMKIKFSVDKLGGIKKCEF
jgi:hypothetical protein